jgi:hypothetical protein
MPAAACLCVHRNHNRCSTWKLSRVALPTPAWRPRHPGHRAGSTQAIPSRAILPTFCQTCRTKLYAPESVRMTRSPPPVLSRADMAHANHPGRIRMWPTRLKTATSALRSRPYPPHRSVDFSLAADLVDDGTRTVRRCRHATSDPATDGVGGSTSQRRGRRRRSGGRPLGVPARSADLPQAGLESLCHRRAGRRRRDLLQCAVPRAKPRAVSAPPTAPRLAPFGFAALLAKDVLRPRGLNRQSAGALLR